MPLELFCLTGDLWCVILLSNVYDLTTGFSGSDKTSGKKLISLILGEVVWFTCQKRFIYFQTTLQYPGICRYLIPCLKTDNIIQDQFLCGNGPFLIFSDDNGFPCCKDRKFVNGYLCPDFLCNTDQCIYNYDLLIISRKFYQLLKKYRIDKGLQYEPLQII